VTDTVTALVPDVEEVIALFHVVDEPLISYLLPVDDLPEGEEDWQMPPSLDVQAVADAWTRILGALPQPLIQAYHRPDEPVPDSYQLHGAGGYEHAAVYPMTVDQADVRAMTGLLDHLRRAMALPRETGFADLREVLDQAADQRNENTTLARYRVGAQDLVDELAAAIDLLRASDDPDGALLLEAVGTPLPGSRITLTADQEAAYGRWIDQLIRKVARGDRIEAALLRFVVKGDM